MLQDSLSLLGRNSIQPGDTVKLLVYRGGLAKVGDIGVVRKVVSVRDVITDFPKQSGYVARMSDLELVGIGPSNMPNDLVEVTLDDLPF